MATTGDLSMATDIEKIFRATEARVRVGRSVFVVERRL